MIFEKNQEMTGVLIKDVKKLAFKGKVIKRKTFLVGDTLQVEFKFKNGGLIYRSAAYCYNGAIFCNEKFSEWKELH